MVWVLWGLVAMVVVVMSMVVVVVARGNGGGGGDVDGGGGGGGGGGDLTSSPLALTLPLKSPPPYRICPFSFTAAPTVSDKTIDKWSARLAIVLRVLRKMSPRRTRKLHVPPRGENPPPVRNSRTWSEFVRFRETA